ncbi:MAG: HVO_A0114 family putative DNA-binding protein [Gaiellaceae bacterium]
MLLAHLLLREEDPLESVSQLAIRLELAISTVQRDVELLEQTGIIHSKRAGRSRVVTADLDYPALGELRALFEKVYGPPQILSELLAGAPGLSEAFIFGSWAARYLGEGGLAPGDIDLLVIGEDQKLDANRVYEAARIASERLGREVNVSIVSEAEWQHDHTGFLDTIRERPLLRLPEFVNSIPGSGDLLKVKPLRRAVSRSGSEALAKECEERI